MNLYLISQEAVSGYDTYDCAIVSAVSKKEARKIHPSTFVTHITDGQWMGTYSGGKNTGGEYENECSSWVKYSDIDLIEVECIGKTNRDRGLVLASFNAG